MSNPTFNRETLLDIASGKWTSFRFTNKTYFWSDNIVTVGTRIGYKRVGDEFVDTLDVTMSHSSGGDNGLDPIETTDAFIECLEQAKQLVRDIRANKAEILETYREILEARRELYRQQEAEVKAKYDADSSISIAAAKEALAEMFEISKKDDYETREQFRTVRRRGEEGTFQIGSDHTGSIVAFYLGTQRMARAKLAKFLAANGAEFV